MADLAKPAPSPETLAEAIVKISTGFAAISKSGLNRKAIVVLLNDWSGVGKRDIERVLNSLGDLSKVADEPRALDRLRPQPSEMERDPMKPVKSSSLAAIGHDPATGVLTVKFMSGQTYRYADVPADQHAKLMSAPSIGSHFQRNIRGAFKEVE